MRWAAVQLTRPAGPCARRTRKGKSPLHLPGAWHDPGQPLRLRRWRATRSRLPQVSPEHQRQPAAARGVEVDQRAVLPGAAAEQGAGPGVGEQVHRVAGDRAQQRLAVGVAGQAPAEGAVGPADGARRGRRVAGDGVDPVEGVAGRAAVEFGADHRGDLGAQVPEGGEPAGSGALQRGTGRYESRAGQPLPQPVGPVEPLDRVRGGGEVQADPSAVEPQHPCARPCPVRVPRHPAPPPAESRGHPPRPRPVHRARHLGAGEAPGAGRHQPPSGAALLTGPVRLPP